MPTRPPTHRIPRANPPAPVRESACARGYGRRWQRASQAYLDTHPLCVRCREDGLVVPATQVDHITPHKGDHTLLWSEDNWQPLCGPCHSRKTATEDGGFGRPVRKEQSNG